MSRIRSCLTLEASKQVDTSLLQLLFDYADVTWREISEGGFAQSCNQEKKQSAPTKAKMHHGKRTFKYLGAIYFNSLPNCVKSATSLNSFKNMIRYLIFSLLFLIIWHRLFILNQLDFCCIIVDFNLVLYILAYVQTPSPTPSSQ